MPRLTPLLAAVLAAGAIAPAAAAAQDSVTIGSDLKARATVFDSDPNDWTAWNTSLPGNSGLASPVKGELNSVKIKGFVLQRYVEPVQVRVLVLRPQGNGQVVHTVASQPLPMPTQRDPDLISTFGHNALNTETTAMCVEPGDFISFFVNGGFEVGERGLQAQVFAETPGAAMDIFKQGNDFGLGRDRGGTLSPYAGTATSGRELLMQATIDTSKTGYDNCGYKRPSTGGGGGGTGGGGTGGGGGGGSTPAEPDKPATLFVKKVRRAVVKRNAFNLELTCQQASACDGQLLITRAKKTLGAKRVSVPADGRLAVQVKLNRLGRKLFRQQGSSLNVVARIKRDGYETVDRAVRIVKPGLK